MNDVTITGDLNHGINWLQENGKRYFQSALYRAANIIKTQAISNLSSSLPASGNHNPKYNDTLQDAIRFTHTEGDEIIVHTMGTRESGSGTYRTRFFELGSKADQRYQKSFKGVPLKKKRYVGKLPSLKFFSSAVASEASKAIQSMEQVIDGMVTNAQKQ
jgi:hypothetical protein